MDYPNNFQVSIVKVTNGYVVTVGCKTIVYTNITELTDDLYDFYAGDTRRVYEKFDIKPYNGPMPPQPQEFVGGVSARVPRY